jgi:hypothetical protein
MKTYIHLKCVIEGNEAPTTFTNMQWRSQDFAFGDTGGVQGFHPKNSKIQTRVCPLYWMLER